MKILFKGVQHVYCAQFLVIVSHNGNPIMKIEIKYTKNVNVLNQNVNMTKRARLATFTVKYCKTI